MHLRRLALKNKQQGSSLLEVMIGLFVLAIGLLGMSSMQNNALRQNNNAYLYSQAVFLANDITERIRANREEVAAYATLFSETPSSSTDCSVNTCTATQIASWDLDEWKTDVTALLPLGRAEVVINDDEVTVAVEFSDSRGEDAPLSITMRTQI